MNGADLARIESRATPGPWKIDGEACCVLATDCTIAHVCIGGADGTDADAALIVAMRNELPHLLSELTRLRAIEVAARKLVQRYGDDDTDERMSALERTLIPIPNDGGM